MRKIIPVFLLVMALFALSAFAQEIYYEAEEGFPRTYADSEIELMSVDGELEKRLLAGWEDFEDEIYIGDLNVSVSECGDLYRKVLYSNPRYYYVNGGFWYSKSEEKVISFIPKYTQTNKEVIKEVLEDIDEETNKILLSISSSMSDFEKVMAVHDYMVLNYEYDMSKEEEAIRSILIMTEKTGVCMGYSFAFTHLMNVLGIESTYVSSDKMNHMWNLVKIDGEWYHIDLTWDDPVKDKFSQVRHTYALISEEKIRSMEKPHYDFDTGDIKADSTLYDDAPWHGNVSSIVSVDGVSYWVDGKRLVDENGKIIYAFLDGGDGRWDIGGGYYYPSNYAGLAEYNGIIYFTTDRAIYSYDPKSEKTASIKNESYIMGIFIDGNELVYSKLDRKNNDLCESGRITLGEARYAVSQLSQDTVTVEVYSEGNQPIRVLSFSSGKCDCALIDKKGLTTVEFEAGSNQKVFFWNEKLQPLKNPVVIGD